MMKTEDRKDWQADPTQITTNQVSVWNRNGTMVTAQMEPYRAKDLVVRGKAYVISSGNIGLCD